MIKIEGAQHSSSLKQLILKRSERVERTDEGTNKTARRVREPRRSCRVPRLRLEHLTSGKEQASGGTTRHAGRPCDRAEGLTVKSSWNTTVEAAGSAARSWTWRIHWRQRNRKKTQSCKKSALWWNRRRKLHEDSFQKQCQRPRGIESHLKRNSVHLSTRKWLQSAQQYDNFCRGRVQTTPSPQSSLTSAFSTVQLISVLLWEICLGLWHYSYISLKYSWLDHLWLNVWG